MKEIVRSGSDLKWERKESPSSRLSHRTEVLRNEPSALSSRKGDFFLPKIENRFNNSHNVLALSKRRENDSVRKMVAIENKSTKMGYLSKNMDVNAL